MTRKMPYKISRREFLKRSIAVAVGVGTTGLLAGCGLTLGESNGKRVAYITQNRNKVENIDLDQVKDTREIQLPNVNVTVQVEKGRIRFLKSDCPDQICVKAGWLEKTGDFAACLPNKAIIIIKD